MMKVASWGSFFVLKGEVIYLCLIKIVGYLYGDMTTE